MRGGYADDNRLGRNLKTDNHTILPLQTDLRTPMHGIWREFDGAFRALEERGKGKALASPSVITIDGMEARVELTQDYPYISERDDAGNPTWSTQTVGPQMTMTPRVGRDGVINLALDLETGEVIQMITGSTGEQMPRTSKRHVTTNVRVRDGEPFVIGGLFSDNKSRTRNRIPILGQLPLLGELFTYRQDEHRKTQVVMLVVPYVLDTPDAAIEQEPLFPRTAAR
ncbi:type II secretion system protein GspD [Fretibacterium fastidiosum]|nr:type II and III secretion system protein [Fretibacterium fastidiosum]